MPECTLCGKGATLRASHILPTFIPMAPGNVSKPLYLRFSGLRTGFMSHDSAGRTKLWLCTWLRGNSMNAFSQWITWAFIWEELKCKAGPPGQAAK